MNEIGFASTKNNLKILSLDALFKKVFDLICIVFHERDGVLAAFY